MDPTSAFCPTLDGPTSGQTGHGTSGLHSWKAPRCRCRQCRKTFVVTQGTACSRRRPPAATVTRVVTWLAHGCPGPALVVACGVDERPVAAGLRRAGRQRPAVHEHVVQTARARGQGQAAAIRVKPHGGLGWRALAMLGSTRLWLAGEVSEPRALPLIRRLSERVRACALRRALLCCPDGLPPSLRALRATFRDAVRPGTRGRPRLRPWQRRRIAQVVQRSERRRVVEGERRIVQGAGAQGEPRRCRSPGAGVSNTADLERLKATCRERLSSLTRRGRALARPTCPLRHGRYLLGTVDNVCTPQASVRLMQPAADGAGVDRTPAMAAGITDHGGSVRARLSFHVPPPRWTPPTRRGRPSRVLHLLVKRWCS
jgi:hypothetical protein